MADISTAERAFLNSLPRDTIDDPWGRKATATQRVETSLLSGLQRRGLISIKIDGDRPHGSARRWAVDLTAAGRAALGRTP